MFTYTTYIIMKFTLNNDIVDLIYFVYLYYESIFTILWYLQKDIIHIMSYTN